VSAAHAALPALGDRLVLPAPLLAEGIGFLEPALPILLYHHEKFDGTGCPLGLAGENIPLEARFFTIVDA